MLKSWRNKIINAVLTVIIIVGVYSSIFQWAMPVFENHSVTFPQSVQVVIESLTTTGYGGFAPWQSDFMNYFVLLMNLTGVVLVFVAFPVFFLPYLRDAIGKTAPRAVDTKDHVIICEYSSYTNALIEELKSRDKDYIIIEQDETNALELISNGYNVMTGDPESEDTLRAACISEATAVVHSEIYKNISIVFTAKNIEPGIKVIAILRDDNMDIYYKLARTNGADITISPRQLVGKSLATQIPAVSINESVEIDSTIELVEIDIEEGSELCNKTIHEANLLNEHHINIIGAWLNGDFKSPVDVDLVLDSKTRLLVAGDVSELEQLTKKAEAQTRHFIRNEVFIFGYGRSGKAAAEFLKDKSVDVRIMDIKEKEGVDMVGDVSKPETLDQMNIEDASAIIITIKDDTAALFSTLMARNKNKKANIIVRANDVEDVQKLYQAGADYVQSLATVTGRMLASCIFEDERSLAVEKQINLVQLPAGDLVGRTLAESNVRAETGCTILGVIRDGKKITTLHPEKFEFQDGDDVILAGTDDSTQLFEKKYLN
ncbi:potassium channel family protein [Gracilimonas mengyeensis]|uniref:Trk K+ transport system, NAD-binding component n=1 Tax=Gracilimonas mengyeensis TaxID=1302730 RepID=A0A521CUY5_9BACT|nr:NAD-binding protein [Gracilimonas mengyeensis]SMO63267.1 Trk K+ transport system, NAD-binding component [Gracilimonas mengyeensis]